MKAIGSVFFYANFLICTLFFATTAQGMKKKKKIATLYEIEHKNTLLKEEKKYMESNPDYYKRKIKQLIINIPMNGCPRAEIESILREKDKDRVKKYYKTISSMTKKIKHPESPKATPEVVALLSSNDTPMDKHTKTFLTLSTINPERFIKIVEECTSPKEKEKDEFYL